MLLGGGAIRQQRPWKLCLNEKTTAPNHRRERVILRSAVRVCTNVIIVCVQPSVVSNPHSGTTCPPLRLSPAVPSLAAAGWSHTGLALAGTSLRILAIHPPRACPCNHRR